MKQPWHRRLAGGLPGWLRGRVLRFEAITAGRLKLFAQSLPPGAWVLDAGAGEARDAQHFAHCHYVAVDLGVGDAQWDYSQLDARADLVRLPFADGRFAAALNIVVLEHIQRPARVLAEIARVLHPGAPFLLVVPQEWGVHQAPHDYFRYTRHGLEWLLEQAGFEHFTIEPVGGFFTLLGRRMLDSVLFFQGGWRWLLFPFAVVLAGPIGLALPSLDFLDRGRETTLGYICLAKKR